MREAVVDRITVAVAVGLALVFGTGVMAGVIAMVAMAIQKQDKRGDRHHASPAPGGRHQ
jgi:hypothetical protein